VYAATAHAPNHVTREQGVKNHYIFGIPDPDMPIHCATFDLEQFSYMAGHVTNLATKLEDPMPIRS